MKDIYIVYAVYATLLFVAIWMLFGMKKDSSIYKVKYNINETVFPLIKIKLFEMMESNEEEIKEMCLGIIDSNIVKTKYTEDLKYYISIDKVKNSDNTRIVYIRIYNSKNSPFNNIRETKNFVLMNSNGHYYIDEADNLKIA